ncbi:MAG: hypothetical protein CFK49_04960 [Armatimonadetes bacterium JP3_11]|jgi:hypothetical protein|nr:MAG: hypothetical protein CFK48_02125 [Armatimonadetes bacterium CP1_7O]OYT75086.1 MAG: hypothetical protein CFK49_04960 [Armatimonadetes bacterium JP3_11]RMH09687.1 MAG: hypothetical protein D6697_02790 [Armatimonadota bacterium]
MNDTLLMILIGLMSLTLLALSWAVIGLLIVAKREIPKLQRQTAQLLDELIPTIKHTTLTLQEAERAIREAAETLENFHIVSDNIRHKLEVADAVGAKLRRVPEKTARMLGRLIHRGFQLGGRMVSQQIEKRFSAKRATVYDGVQGLKTSPKQIVPVPTDATGGETGASVDMRATVSENSAPQVAESIPAGEATTNTTHKEG